MDASKGNETQCAAYETTGKRLRDLMRKRGISYRKLAEMSEIDICTIRRMCNGDRVGYFYSWAKVLKALDADANDFLK